MSTSDSLRASETFLHLARIYLDVNGLGPQWQGYLVQQIMGMNDPRARSEFLEGLEMAMSGKGATAREYELATGWAFDTEDEYRAHLQELWARFPRSA